MNNFTRQDALTFAIGLGAALLLQLGTALAQLDSAPIEDAGRWFATLGTGLLSAGGRYIVTKLAERVVE